MRSLMLKLWQDDGGALISTEWVFVATILILGITIGLVAIRNAVNAELATFSNAVLGLNQCYSFSGQTLTCAPGGGGTGNVVAGTCGSNTGTSTNNSRVSITSTIPPAGPPITVTPCQ